MFVGKHAYRKIANPDHVGTYTVKTFSRNGVIVEKPRSCLFSRSRRERGAQFHALGVVKRFAAVTQGLIRVRYMVRDTEVCL